ncbi:putative peptidoglycan glycosyltransferase FtsW [Ferrovibrio sp.]|uniref:FtsW/RodA/SpoVE family cell cycle protein n=1 Tax=Ferrovibrio sp. TaxID=1917215 RepID=UPI001B56599A|nr:putative peptidoglycan glycosyltransferase FtsW [Ferrovibrio sp.]MBP7065405.1 cell division protein FtsW [Ferrovibrio sp.]
MITLSRTDTSIVGRWWWTVDRWLLMAVGVLVIVGCVLTLAASPAVANRIGLGSFHFVQRQLLFLVPALLIMLGTSLLSPLGVRRLASIVFLGALFGMFLTFVIGVEVKGAHRWIYFAGVSLQPSEFVKPTFAVVSAWLFAEWRRGNGFPGWAISGGLCALVLGTLLLQPDLGMAVVVAAVWAAQFFIAGLPMLLVIVLAALGAAGIFGAYSLLPHVAARFDKFLDPSGKENYQIERAMEAFSAGGLLGRGPGEGSVKNVLPDAHTDFIFAVAGEEFGLFACLFILAVFAFIVLRCFGRLMTENNLFVLLAAAGLTTQFGLQAVINIGVNLHLLPTKGMTLPFISYGGSSLLALAFAMGMLLALTRWRPEHGVAR